MRIPKEHSPAVRRTRRAIVVHEACKRCGWGVKLAQRTTEKAFDDLDAPVMRLAGQDVPLPYEPDLKRARCPKRRRSSRPFT